jgi:hypothetical protein
MCFIGSISLFCLWALPQLWWGGHAPPPSNTRVALQHVHVICLFCFLCASRHLLPHQDPPRLPGHSDPIPKLYQNNACLTQLFNRVRRRLSMQVRAEGPLCLCAMRGDRHMRMGAVRGDGRGDSRVRKRQKVQVRVARPLCLRGMCCGRHMKRSCVKWLHH